MELSKLSEACVTILCIVMFGVQLRIATLNLMYPPMVDSSYERDLTANDLPVITICPSNQTRDDGFEKLKYNGGLNDMLKGFALCNGTTECISWGNHLKLTFDEALRKVFDITYSSDITISPFGKDKEVYLPMMGFCKEVSNLTNTEDVSIKLRDQNNAIIFISNPSTRSYFMPDLSSGVGDKIGLEAFKTTYLHVKIEVKSVCKLDNNEMSRDDYSKCIDDELNKMFEESLNCTPPWLSPSNQCDGMYNREVYLTNSKLMENAIFKPLLNFGNTKVELDCRKSCLTTRFKVEKRGVADRWSNHHAYLTFDHKVSVTEKIANYSWFQFIIDVGSSLGLWLGLSVLGIHDLVVTALEYIKNNFMYKQFKDLFKNNKA